CVLCWREQYQVESVAGAELRTDDQLELQFSCGFMGAHHACHRAFVRDGESLIAKRLRAFNQLMWMRGATQKREIGYAMQLGVGGHDQNPCRYQRESRRSLNTHRSGPYSTCTT